VTDFFYPGPYYKNVYESTGLKWIQTLKPRGKPQDNITWKDEIVCSPYRIDVLIKSKDHEQLHLKTIESSTKINK